MKYKDDLTGIFGHAIVHLTDFVKSGKVSDNHLKAMADLMGATPVYASGKDRAKENVFILEDMLDSWYEQHVCSHQSDAQEELRRVLVESHCSQNVIFKVTEDFRKTKIDKLLGGPDTLDKILQYQRDTFD